MNKFIYYITEAIEIFLVIVHFTIGLRIFFVLVFLVILTWILVSVDLSIQAIRGESYLKIKKINPNEEETTNRINKWLRTLKKLYWCGFACSLLTTPIFLYSQVPPIIVGYLLAAIVFSWILGSIIMIIAFSELKKSFSKKYILLAILALYLSYWYLYLWMLTSFFVLLKPGLSFWTLRFY